MRSIRSGHSSAGITNAIELCFCEQRVAKKGIYLRKRIMPVNTISALLSFTFIKMVKGYNTFNVAFMF